MSRLFKTKSRDKHLVHMRLDDICEVIATYTHKQFETEKDADKAIEIIEKGRQLNFDYWLI